MQLTPSLQKRFLSLWYFGGKYFTKIIDKPNCIAGIWLMMHWNSHSYDLIEGRFTLQMDGAGGQEWSRSDSGNSLANRCRYSTRVSWRNWNSRMSIGLSACRDFFFKRNTHLIELKRYNPRTTTRGSHRARSICISEWSWISQLIVHETQRDGQEEGWIAYQIAECKSHRQQRQQEPLQWTKASPFERWSVLASRDF